MTECNKEGGCAITTCIFIEIYMMNMQSLSILGSSTLDTLMIKKCPDALFEFAVELHTVWLEGDAPLPKMASLPTISIP